MSDERPWTAPLPPWTTNASGELRRVGVEIELIGPDVAAVTDEVRKLLGGVTRVTSRYEQTIHAESGDWGVELDFELLKQWGRETSGDDEPGVLEELAEDVLRLGAEAVVPVEVVSPPLPLDQLGLAQRVVAALRGIGARGTGAGLTYAFGMQLNPELPRLDVDTILAYLRAYLCLQEWLVRESHMDLTRRLTGYSASFPTAYVKKVVDPDYAPDLATLIDDYLEANPTRNRSLDMLPLFTELDEERVRAFVDDERVKPRPTFHFRLPNSEIDDPAWGVHVAWGSWLVVERLAADPERLDEITRRYRELLDRTVEHWLGDWPEEVDTWLRTNGLVSA